MATIQMADVNWYDISRDLRAKNDRLETAVAALAEQNERCRSTNAALAARVQALEAALDAKIDEAAKANDRAEKWKVAAIALDTAVWKAMDWAEGTRIYNASVEVEALNLQEATLKPALAGSEVKNG